MPRCAWRNGRETSLPPHCAPRFTLLHLEMFACSLTPLHVIVFVFSVLSAPTPKWVHCQGGVGLVDEQVTSHFFFLLLHVTFSFFSAVVFLNPLHLSLPLFSCLSFLLYADFSLTVFDSQLWWRSDLWSASRPKGHCTAYLCVCEAEHACSFETCVVVCVCVTFKESVSCHISHRVAVSAEHALSVSPWTTTLGEIVVGFVTFLWNLLFVWAACWWTADTVGISLYHLQAL